VDRPAINLANYTEPF